MSIIVNSLQFKNWTHCSVYTWGTVLYVLCIRFPEEIFSVWKYVLDTPQWAFFGIYIQSYKRQSRDTLGHGAHEIL